MKWTVCIRKDGQVTGYELVTEHLSIFIGTDDEGGWLYSCPAIDLGWVVAQKTSPIAVQREAVRAVHKIVRAMFIEAEGMFEKYGRARSVKEEEAR